MDILLKVMFPDLDMLKEKLPEIELQNVGKKLTLYFKSTADSLISGSVNDSNNFYQTLLETALPLKYMMAKASNNLDDDTTINIEQVTSIPIHLLTLVSMLIDGPVASNRQFSQPALTVAQLIQTYFHKNRSHDIEQSRKILKTRETPVALYLKLKIYRTFRFKTVIDHLFNLGLCLLNDRILEFTKKLSHAQIENYELTGVFSSTPFSKSRFTVVAKYQVDLNATSSTAVKHFHRTTMIVGRKLRQRKQFPKTYPIDQ